VPHLLFLKFSLFIIEPIHHFLPLFIKLFLQFPLSLIELSPRYTLLLLGFHLNFHFLSLHVLPFLFQPILLSPPFPLRLSLLFPPLFLNSAHQTLTILLKLLYLNSPFQIKPFHHLFLSPFAAYFQTLLFIFEPFLHYTLWYLKFAPIVPLLPLYPLPWAFL